MRRLIKTWREARAKAKRERMLASNDIMAYYERMLGKPFGKPVSRKSWGYSE